jgi:hypothetical protein
MPEVHQSGMLRTHLETIIPGPAGAVALEPCETAVGPLAASDAGPSVNGFGAWLVRPRGTFSASMAQRKSSPKRFPSSRQGRIWRNTRTENGGHARQSFGRPGAPGDEQAA